MCAKTNVNVGKTRRLRLGKESLKKIPKALIPAAKKFLMYKRRGLLSPRIKALTLQLDANASAAFQIFIVKSGKECVDYLNGIIATARTTSGVLLKKPSFARRIAWVLQGAGGAKVADFCKAAGGYKLGLLIREVVSQTVIGVLNEAGDNGALKFGKAATKIDNRKLISCLKQSRGKTFGNLLGNVSTDLIIAAFKNIPDGAVIGNALSNNYISAANAISKGDYRKIYRIAKR